MKGFENNRWYLQEFLQDIGKKPRHFEYISGLQLLIDYRPYWYRAWLWFVRITGFRLRGY